MLVIAAHVGIEQPMQPTAAVAIRVRPQGQMNMVWHQTASQKAHRNFRAGMVDSLEKSLIIAVFVADALACIAPIEDMVADAADRSSCGAWHKCQYNIGEVDNQEKR